MKKALLFFCSIAALNSIKAQDTILKINGDVIIAKISEITTAEVRYQRYGFQDGPKYVELKSNIAMITYVNGVKEIFKKEGSERNPSVNANKNIDFQEPVSTNRHIEITGNQYQYQGAVYSERRIQQLLLDTKNSEIMGFVSRAKQAQKIQFIGFAAIPLGIAGLVAIGSATRTTYTYNPSTGMDEYATKTNNNLVALGVVCISGAITCPIVSGVFKRKRKSYNSEAIRLYNEKY